MSLQVKGVVDAISRAMNRIAPLTLAEAWDNVGLLLESPVDLKPSARRILLTIDLTESVVQEALSPSSSGSTTAAIVCYHPPIFRGLKSLTLSNSLQKSLLTCAANGISIYSPHTTLDSTKGGVNDWLANVVASKEETATVTVLSQIPNSEEGSGIGRKVTFDNGLSLDEVVRRVKTGLKLDYVQLARSRFRAHDELVKTVALCAGSGGSVLSGVVADVYFTGELGHHEVLAAVARGTHVILCGHSNTERGYLPTFKTKLEAELQGLGVEVEVSTTDEDPLRIV